MSWHTLEWTPLLMALLFAIAQELTNPWIAKFSLRAVGRDESYLRLLAIVTTSATSNAMIPLPAGIPLRIWLQQHWLSVPYATSVSAALIESIVSYGILAVTAITSLLLWAPDIFEATRSQAPWPLIAAVAVTIIVVAALGARTLKHRGSILIKELARSSRPSLKWAGLVALIAALGILLAYWRLQCIGNALPTSHIDWGLAFVGLVVSRLAGVVSMIPMGLGARDLSLGYFLVLAGVHPEIAATWATLDRIAMTVPYVACGLASLPIVHRLRKSHQNRPPHFD